MILFSMYYFDFLFNIYYKVCFDCFCEKHKKGFWVYEERTDFLTFSIGKFFKECRGFRLLCTGEDLADE